VPPRLTPTGRRHHRETVASLAGVGGEFAGWLVGCIARRQARSSAQGAHERPHGSHHKPPAARLECGADSRVPTAPRVLGDGAAAGSHAAAVRGGRGRKRYPCPAAMARPGVRRFHLDGDRSLAVRRRLARRIGWSGPAGSRRRARRDAPAGRRRGPGRDRAVRAARHRDLAAVRRPTRRPRPPPSRPDLHLPDRADAARAARRGARGYRARRRRDLPGNRGGLLRARASDGTFSAPAGALRGALAARRRAVRGIQLLRVVDGGAAPLCAPRRSARRGVAGAWLFRRAVRFRGRPCDRLPRRSSRYGHDSVRLSARRS
jgi:hypothetical protein